MHFANIWILTGWLAIQMAIRFSSSHQPDVLFGFQCAFSTLGTSGLPLGPHDFSCRMVDNWGSSTGQLGLPSGNQTWLSAQSLNSRCFVPHLNDHWVGGIFRCFACCLFCIVRPMGVFEALVKRFCGFIVSASALRRILGRKSLCVCPYFVIYRTPGISW